MLNAFEKAAKANSNNSQHQFWQQHNKPIELWSPLNEKIEKFKYAFQTTSKDVFWDDSKRQLIHSSEYGAYRESICKELIRALVPGRLDISDGFLINDTGEISTQCDIIIYDKNSTPLIENNERQRFFPIETVCAIGEIKSDLSKADLKVALNKLALNKSMRERMSSSSVIRREHVGKFDPINYPYDSIFSFLICNKFNFNISDLVNQMDSMYENNIMHWQRHNLILSINDGLLAYFESAGKTFMYPILKGQLLKNRFVTPKVNPNVYFEFFSSYLFMGTSSSSIFYPEISAY